MVWFFEREQEVTRVETRFDSASKEYVIVIEAPNRERKTERFSNSKRFKARLTVLEQQFRSENWVQRGDVQFLTDGWRGPTGRSN
jgi:hypothetical protein